MRKKGAMEFNRNFDCAKIFMKQFEILKRGIKKCRNPHQKFRLAFFRENSIIHPRKNFVAFFQIAKPFCADGVRAERINKGADLDQ